MQTNGRRHKPCPLPSLPPSSPLPLFFFLLLFLHAPPPAWKGSDMHSRWHPNASSKSACLFVPSSSADGRGVTCTPAGIPTVPPESACLFMMS